MASSVTHHGLDAHSILCDACQKLFVHVYTNLVIHKESVHQSLKCMLLSRKTVNGAVSRQKNQTKLTSIIGNQSIKTLRQNIQYIQQRIIIFHDFCSAS